MDWLKSHLVEDARDAWKWFSTWIFGIITVLPIVWPQMPSDLKAALPADLMPYVSALAFAGLVLRLVKQGPKE